MTYRLVSVAAAVALLAGCETNGFNLNKSASTADASVSQSIPKDKITSDQRVLAAEGVGFLDKAEYQKASQSFNQALKLDIENSYLQFLNGLSYHLLALKGDVSMFPLAQKGYELAIQFDRSNWIAHYHLGLLYLDQRKFVPAQEKFSEAILFVDDDPDILYSLAVASYYAQDPVTAAGALDRARQLDPKNENILRASSLIMAALGQSEKATEFKDHYIQAAVSAPEAKQLTRRLMDWQRFHSRDGNVLLAQRIEVAPVIAVESETLPSVVAAKTKEQTAKELMAAAEKAKSALREAEAKSATANQAAQAALQAAKANAAAANRSAQAALHAAKAKIESVAKEGAAALQAAEARIDATQKAADDAVAAADKAMAEDAPEEAIVAAEALVETTALAADEAVAEIDTVEEAAATAEEKALEAFDAAEEAVATIEEEYAALVEAAEEKAATVEEETATDVEAADEVATTEIEKAQAAVDLADEAAAVAAEDMAAADEAAIELAVMEVEAAAERAAAALDLATMAADEASAAAEAAVDIGESEVAAADAIAAAENSAAQAATAVEAATTASETALAMAEKVASEESAATAKSGAAAAQAAAAQAAAAANTALAAAGKAKDHMAAAKEVVAEIAFFKDPETDQAQEDPVVDENKMVIVDVVIIRTEEDNTTSKGVNLLNGLTLQFGGGLSTTAAFGRSSVSVKSNDSPGLARTITRAINIPSITYSLNIANSATERNEILARPTLVALAEEESTFFSGIGIQASAIGGANNSGTAVEVNDDIGVSLSVTPSFLDDGRVKLKVRAKRTFLSTPNNTSITYTFRIDTSKTEVDANVAMNFGETLILSGLSEKETERISTGVPFLQDIPGVQYLFSNRTTRDFQKSVLILLTPRPPNYVQQSEKGMKQSRKSMNKEERVLSELQARYSDWFRPYPNWASVFNHLQQNSLYREFRTGDVSMEKWESQEGFKGRLKKAMEFLYH